jgi:hypothetical protein
MQADEGYVNFMKAQVVIDALKRLYADDMSEFYELLYAVSKCLQEQQDIELFVKFCTKIFNSGYHKSVIDHKAALEKQGLTTKVIF